MRSAILLSALALALGVLRPLAAGAEDVPPEAVIAMLPFLEVEEPNRIYLDLAAEGAQPFRLMLDTGATHAVLTPLAARAAGVSIRAIKDTPYRRKTRLGRDLQFYIDTASSDTGSRTGWEYGLLGGDFMKSYVVELDFAARSVRFLDPRRYSLLEAAPAADESVLVLRDSPRPITSMSIGGRELPVLVDTGQPWSIMLSGKAAKAAGIDVASLPSWGKVGTTLGDVELLFHEAADVTIGAFHFANVPVLVAPTGVFNIGGEADDSTIGYDLLSRFLVRIDYRGRRMLLRRKDDRVVNYGVDYSLERESGAFLMPWQVGQRVVYVRPDSPAAKRGLLVGDFIERSHPADTPESSLRAIVDGKRLAVRREQGDRVVHVTLEASPSAAQP